MGTLRDWICSLPMRYVQADYTQVPVAYLKWMVQSSHSRAEIADAELTRRGTVTPDLDISGHAIDRASLNCRKIWHETALDKNEGLHAWLVRMAGIALKNEPDEKGRHHHAGMKFVFEPGKWPVLKTVMPE